MNKKIKKTFLVLIILTLSLTFMGCEISPEIEKELNDKSNKVDERMEKITMLIPDDQQIAFQEAVTIKLEEKQVQWEKDMENKLDKIIDKDIEIENLSEEEQLDLILNMSEESLNLLYEEVVQFLEAAEIIIEDTALEYISQDELAILELNPSKWAISSVATAKRESLTKGIDLNNLKEEITRKEFATLVANIYEDMSGEKVKMLNKNTFKDTDDEDVLKAAKIGIVNGVGEGRFNPEGKVTREQMAVMMHRLMDSLELNAPVTMEYRYFADEDEISSWAKASVQLLNKLEIVNGVGQEKIDPKGSATKEQALVMGVRLFERFK